MTGTSSATDPYKDFSSGHDIIPRLSRIPGLSLLWTYCPVAPNDYLLFWGLGTPVGAKASRDAMAGGVSHLLCTPGKVQTARAS